MLAMALENASSKSSAAYQEKDTTFRKIFVGGLPYHTTNESLRSFFERFGPIEEAVVITDRQTDKSRGYGFVTMAREQDAINAIKDPNPCIDGRKANVNLAIIGAKPRNIPGVTNANTLMAMENTEFSMFGGYPAAAAAAALMASPSIYGTGALNPAFMTTLLSATNTVGQLAGVQPILPGVQNPTSTLNGLEAQRSAYFNRAAGMLGAENQYNNLPFMYGPNGWVENGQAQQPPPPPQQQQAFNLANNAPANTLPTPGFPTQFNPELEAIMRAFLQQNQQPPPPQQQMWQSAQSGVMNRGRNSLLNGPTAAGFAGAQGAIQGYDIINASNVGPSAPPPPPPQHGQRRGYM